MNDESLDQALEKDPAVLTTTEGTIFSNMGAAALCAVLSVMGVVLISNMSFGGVLIGLVLFGIGLCGLTFSYGVQVDINNNRHREFSALIGIKFGQWKSLLHYPYVTVLKNNESKSVRANPIMSTTYSDEDLGIYLLNKTHYQKILLEKHDEYKKAMERAKFFCDKMKKEYAEYSPVRISKRR